MDTQAAELKLIKVNVETVGKGYPAKKLAGKTVVNDKGETIGEIDDIIIGPDARALFAIIDVGGFLQLSKHLVAVPFSSLVLKDGEKKIELPGASRDELKALAEFKYIA
jgi:sporulation protein YlmC with PRC-barrel domain